MLCALQTCIGKPRYLELRSLTLELQGWGENIRYGIGKGLDLGLSLTYACVSAYVALTTAIGL